MLGVGMTELQPRYLDLTIIKRELYREFINDRHFNVRVSVKYVIVCFLQKLI